MYLNPFILTITYMYDIIITNKKGESMSKFLMDALKTLQDTSADVLKEYDMDCTVDKKFVWGKNVAVSFRELCRMHDELVKSKATGEPWQNAVGRLYKFSPSDDARYSMFRMQTALPIAKTVYPEQSLLIDATAQGTTKHNLETIIKEHGIGAVIDFKDNFQPVLNAFKDERLADHASDFQPALDAVEEAFNSITPYEKPLQEADAKLSEIHSQEDNARQAYLNVKQACETQKTAVMDNLFSKLNQTTNAAVTPTEQ